MANSMALVNINPYPNPNLSAVLPNSSDKLAVSIVRYNDCAEMVEASISLGTRVANTPVNIGFLMLSTMYIVMNDNKEIVHNSNW